MNGSDPRSRRLVVVSHPAVLPLNQLPYAALIERGWDAQLVVPDRWRHEFSAGDFAARPQSSLADRLHRRPVIFRGSVQRHLYRVNPVSHLRDLDPAVVFVEAECFSVPTVQWGMASYYLGVPFGVQAAENVDRKLPVAARMIRRIVLPRTAFVAARTPAAARLVRSWGASGPVEVIPHHVPAWPAVERRESDSFRVGFAGRLAPEKGVDTLLAAVVGLEPPVELVVAGDGPLRGCIEEADLDRTKLRLLTDLDHADMHRAYGQMDVLVLPSRTTPGWVEQFGRVLVEALSCGVPVVGSDSGEIPWVIDTTGGGRVVPEGDAGVLRATLAELRADPSERTRLADEGRRRVRELFSVEAVADGFEATLNSVVEHSGRSP